MPNAARQPATPVARFFKVVGYLTALLTLGFAITKAWQALDGIHERQLQIDELLATAEVEMIGSDYGSAWATVGRAEEVAESLPRRVPGLDTRTDLVRQRREDIAMAWLRDARTSGNETFSNLVEPLLPVVTRGVTLSEGARKADLLAHVGWANFLRYRETRSQATDFERYYEEAIALDPDNTYANGFWGHWILWNGGEGAADRFDAALAGGRDVRFVRLLQLAGLANRASLENDVGLARLAAELTDDVASAPEGLARAVWNAVYNGVINNGTEIVLEAVLDGVPPTEHVAVFEVFFGPGSRVYEENRWERDMWLAWVLDRAGRRADGLALLRETLAYATAEGLSEHRISLTREAIARFSGDASGGRPGSDEPREVLREG